MLKQHIFQSLPSDPGAVRVARGKVGAWMSRYVNKTKMAHRTDITAYVRANINGNFFDSSEQ